MIGASTKRLRLLGPARVEQILANDSPTCENVDGVVPRFRSSRTKGLLGYLVTEQRPVARDHLAAMFWPDEMHSKGRSNLSRELHNLAQVLPDCWESNRQMVAFIPSEDTIVDLYQLQQLEAQELWEEAADLLCGEFLEGLSLNLNPELENWLLFERQRWHRFSQTVLSKVIEGHTRRGHYTDALRFTQRQLQLAPWNENAHIQTMRLLAWTDQRDAALRQFETCKQALQKELDVEPGEGTIALYQQIQAGKLDLPPQLPPYLTEEKARHEYIPIRFVGREDELAKLHKFFEEVLIGKSRVVFISGGPGWGKTTLLEAFSQQAMATHPKLLVVGGKCSAYSGVGDPYLPYLEMMAMLTGDVDTRWDAGAITRDHARRLWAAVPTIVQVLLDLGPHLIDIFVPGSQLLSRLMAAGNDQDANLPRLRELIKLHKGRKMEVEQTLLFQQFTNVLLTISKSHPLLLNIDDLQWADTASISLLFHLGRRLTEMGSRLLIACAYRPEEVSMINQGEHHPLSKILSEFKRTFGDIWVDLGRIDKVKDRRFVDTLLDIERNRLGGNFRDALFNRTGGHPLFTSELLRDMLDRGDLIKDSDDAWIEGPTLDWELLPARVEAVIEERVDWLDSELREILTIASVEGEVFTAQVVAEVQNMPERSMLRWLSRELERRYRLVIEQEEVVTGQRRMSRYSFRHILFRDYLYKRLSQGERQLLHREVAAALERLFEGHLDEKAAQLAHHFCQAGDHDLTFKYLCLAAERAARYYASDEAIKYYSQAIEIYPLVGPDISALADLYRGSGLAWESLGDFERSCADHETVLQITRAAGEHRLEWRTLIDLGRLWTSRDYDRSNDYYEQALKLARRIDDPSILANSLNWMGNWHINAENPKKAIEAHQEALTIIEAAGDQRDLANTLDLLGIASLLGGDCKASATYYDRAIALFRELDDRPSLVSSLIGRGNIGGAGYCLLTLAPTIKLFDAQRDFEEAIQLARETNSPASEAWALWSLGLSCIVQGNFGYALEAIQNGLRIACEINHLEWMVGNQAALGGLYIELFEFEAARRHLEEALLLAKELRSQTWIHRITGLLAAAFHFIGDLERTQTYLDTVITPHTPMDTMHKRYCWARGAELALAQGDPALALDITEQLIKTAPGMSPGRIITYLWWLKGKAVAALCDASSAHSYFQMAIENTRATGERFLLWRIHASCGHLYRKMGQLDASEMAFLEARKLIDELATTISDEMLKDIFLAGAHRYLIQ